MMKRETSNIVLIGMPGAGKSTVGVILAKQTSLGFIDTDVVIQSSQGRSLQDIIDHDGYLALRRIEEEIVLGLRLQDHVIATGGSVVYSDAAMAHLGETGVVVFLDVDLPILEARVRDLDTRGLARRPGQGLAELFAERLPLYTQHADLVIQCGRLAQEQVCARIVAQWKRDGGERPHDSGRPTGRRGGSAG